jgi:DNA-binding SARP family transcriptional activator
MLNVTVPPTIRLQLLGGATLAAGDGKAVRLSTQKGMALLVYLAMHPGRAIARSVLADLLWGDRVDGQARQNLRQCLLSLRRDLGQGMAHVLQANDQSLTLRAVEIDAVQFIELAEAADPVRREQCLALSWGPFLANFSTEAEAFDEWARAERHRLDTIAIRTFAEFAQRFDDAGDGGRAILALERLVAIDPSEEERHRRLISLEARYRGPDSALARAKSLAALLKRELDAEPERATLALVDDIRRSTATRLRAEEIRHGGDAAQEGSEIAAAANAPAALERPGLVSRSPRQRIAMACAMAAVALAGIGLGLIYSQPVPTGGPPAVPSPQPVEAVARWQSPRLGPTPAIDPSANVESSQLPCCRLPVKAASRPMVWPRR